MSKTSDGTRLQPQFASSGNAPTFAADLTLTSDYAAEYGNTKIGTTTQRNAFTPWEGLVWYDTTLDVVTVWTGAAWLTIKAMGQTGHPFAEAAGRVLAASSIGQNTVVFPASRFSVAPIVSVTPNNAANAGLIVEVPVAQITASQFRVDFFDLNGFVSGVGFHWRAVQMTSSVAAG